MSEPTRRGDTCARTDWSQVYTNLDWVAGWMADRGYTDAEIAYVVARPASPTVDAEVAFAAVKVPPLVDVFETGEPVGTTSSGVPGADDTDEAESSQQVPA
jgi:hypothetical protein